MKGDRIMPVNKWVLLVEDNEDDIDLTLRALKANHIVNEVKIARDGASALEIIFGAKVLPMLVLLDVNLPKMNGTDVLQRVRNNPATSRLPVVILTSSKEQEDKSRGYDLGANSYVRKPVDFDQFREVVKQLGLYWLVLNEPPPLKDQTF
jgi:two-component system, response regulator